MFEEAKKEEVEEKTTTQDASPEETKADESKEDETSQKNEEESEEKKEERTPEEIDLAFKKANDFDGIMEKRRLEKLNKKDDAPNPFEKNIEEQKGLSPEEIKKMIDQGVDAKIAQMNKDVYDANLSQAYKKFKAEHPWADTDSNFGKISDAFTPGGSNDVDSLTNQLKRAAQEVFPTEYEKAVKDKMRSEIINEKTNIDAGDISGGGSGIKEKKDDAPKEKKFFKGQQPITEWYKKPEEKK